MKPLTEAKGKVQSSGNTPLRMRREARWAGWRNENREGKPSKVPYSVKNHRADSTNADDWTDYDSALAALNNGAGWAGLGFRLGDGFAGVDLDGCRDPKTGDIDSRAWRIINALDSYAEVSPSGTGVKVFLRGDVENLKVEEVFKQGEHSGVELYGSKRYFAVTGEHLAETPRKLNLRSKALAALRKEMAEWRADNNILRKARTAKNGAKFQKVWDGDLSGYEGDQNRADQALCSMLAFYTSDSSQIDRLFRRSGLFREKWQREDYRERTINKALAGKNATIVVSSEDLQPIAWVEFWKRERRARWLAEPVLLRGGVTDIHALPAVGKSLLGLDIAVHIATGLAVLNRKQAKPLNVVYLDLEMTEDDLEDRLREMGFDEKSHLSHLHYYLLPDLPPLDTPEGGKVLLSLVKKHKAWLVVIDTTSEVIGGNENDSETFRNLYRHSLYPLKRAGITVLKTDHEGHESGRSRGSSAKRDKVDIQWRMTRGKGNGRILRQRKARQRAVPRQVDLVIEMNPLHHQVIPHIEILNPNAKKLAAEMAKLGIPINASVREAREALRKARRGRSTELVTEAVRYRKSTGNRPEKGRRRVTGNVTG